MFCFKHFTKEQFASCWEASREKIFHIGSGGMISDGLKMDTTVEDECLKLIFNQNTDTEEQVAMTQKHLYRRLKNALM